VSGNTLFTQSLSAFTISASTYLGLPSEIFVTGGTYNPNNGVATFTNNTGGTFNVNGFLTGFTDIYVTGGTYNSGTTTLQLTRTDGQTVSVTGFTTNNSGTNRRAGRGNQRVG
jgi:hypothetical protein